MNSFNSYPENVREILDTYGETVIKNPMTGEKAPLSEAVVRCVKDGENHLVMMLSQLSLEEAGIIVQDLAGSD